MYSFSSFFAKYLAYMMIFLRTFVVLNLVLWNIIKYAKKKQNLKKPVPSLSIYTIQHWQILTFLILPPKEKYMYMYDVHVCIDIVLTQIYSIVHKAALHTYCPLAGSGYDSGLCTTSAHENKCLCSICSKKQGTEWMKYFWHFHSLILWLANKEIWSGGKLKLNYRLCFWLNFLIQKSGKLK